MVQNCDDIWNDGITNGADWYSVQGGLQDYNYLKHGTMHLTIELSCDKFATDGYLKELVENNKKSLLYWVYYVGKVPSIYGKVSSSSFKNKKIEFQLLDEFDHMKSVGSAGRFYTFTNEHGEFRKFLPEYGVYNLVIEGEIFETVTITKGGSHYVFINGSESNLRKMGSGIYFLFTKSNVLA